MRAVKDEWVRERSALLLVATFTLLACACRLPLLFTGIWRDEGSTFFDVTAPTVARMLREISATEITPPGFFLLMRGWVTLFGTSETMLKIPALVFGTALVPATYALARAFGSRGPALLAAGFAAFSLTAVTLSTEARAYTCCALLGAVAVTLGLRYLGPDGGPGSLAAYLGVAVALVYVHYTGLVLIASFAFGCLAFAPSRAAWRKLALFEGANVIVACAIAPWLPHAAGARHAVFLERPGGASFIGRFVEQFGFVLPVDYMHVQYAFLFVSALVVFGVRYVARGSDARPMGEARFVAASLTLLAGTCIETALSLHEQRYMFAFTPLANALAATLCWALLAPVFAPRAGPVTRVLALRAAFGAALAASVLVGIPKQARAFERPYSVDRSGVRRLAAETLPWGKGRTLVVVAPDYLAPTVAYYLRERPGLTLVGIPQWDSPEHPRCCTESWYDPHMASILSRRIHVAASHGYATIAYVYDRNAYDEGPLRYTKIFELRNCLTRTLTVVGERRYDGSKERIGLTLFRAPQK
ncbi:MAG: glycosyltransferase family 39 protein [Candidatus Eremiobacteraeota bacterium]|nr:glycosyltransferase family 39 protein [Candidatus Eremiobacteraeota bacterium]